MEQETIITEQKEQGKVVKPKRTKKPLPKVQTESIQLPEVNTEVKQLPEYIRTSKPLPPEWNTQNVIIIDDDPILIKPTKLKYQRDRTAAFYRVVQIYPLPDILAMQTGFVDQNRDGDKCLFDWIIAVTDNVQYVNKHYQDMDAETIQRLLSIFKRLNKIDDKEEQAKNRRAKEQNH